MASSPAPAAPAAMALRVRPRARFVGIVVAGAGLMWAGASLTHASLVWFGVALLSVAVVAVGWFAVSLAIDSGRRLERIVVPPVPQVGRAARVRLAASRRVPAWATLTDRAPAELVTGSGDHFLDLVPGRRGYLRLGPARIHREDPFALLRWSRDLGGATDHLVWPRTDGASPALLAALEGNLAAFTGIPHPDIDDASVRDYQFGDPLERVHWKLSAKHSSLLVRRDEPTRSVQLDLVLAASADAAATDAAVDVLAAVAATAIGPGRDVRVLTDEVTEPRVVSDALTALALATSYLAAPPALPPRDLVVIALAHRDPAVVASWADWVRLRREPSPARVADRVLVVPLVPLTPQCEALLAGCTVVSP